MKRRMQLLSSMRVKSSKSLVVRVSRNPTDLSMIDIYENDLKVGVRLVGFSVVVVVVACLLFP